MSKSIDARSECMTVAGPLYHFRLDHYVRYNARRLEFLARLDLPIACKTVIELGAGIGDLSQYFIDRACKLTSTDGRSENVSVLSQRYSGKANVLQLDIEAPDFTPPGEFDVVCAMGILYHLADPASGLANMAKCCREIAIIETCVSYGSESEINPCLENGDDPTQALRGAGCRPTRPWVYRALREHFPFVYVPISQPWHDEFPTDWNTPPPPSDLLSRSFFIASRQPLIHLELKTNLPLNQTRR